MSADACCTCASLLSPIPGANSPQTEKPTVFERRLDCCNRIICSKCISNNERFRTYCPFCQISTKPTPLPQGLRDPPPYAPPEDEIDDDSKSMSTSVYTELPRYQDLYHKPQDRRDEKITDDAPAEDVLHFVHPANDTIRSLAIRYNVPGDALRRKNGIFQDHLLAGRKAILIPGEFYKGGVSLSPRPVDGEEEELRKNKIRKWMVACKVHE